MPIGFGNAAQSFQCFVDQAYPGLKDVHAYTEDVLVASANHDERLAHLCAIIHRLAQHGVTIGVAKCSFEQSQIDFLGHHISPTGISSRADKIQAILDYLEQNSRKKHHRLKNSVNS